MDQMESFVQIYDDMLSYMESNHPQSQFDTVLYFAGKYSHFILNTGRVSEAISDASDKKVYFRIFAKELSNHAKDKIAQYPEDARAKIEELHYHTMTFCFLPTIASFKLPDFKVLCEVFIEVWNELTVTKKVITKTENSEKVSETAKKDAAKETSFSFTEMYDDMLSHIADFNQKNYESLFMSFIKKYGDSLHTVILEKSTSFSEDKDKEICFSAFAEELTDHVKKIIEEYPAKKREKISIDQNVTMVAYFLPVITYYKESDFMLLGEIFVNQWNESKVTKNTLHLSTYDAIASGFKRSLCYITTAVCDTLHKPDDCYELTLLRDYRDHYLAKTKEGSDLIKEYYHIAPRIVLSIDTFDSRTEIYKDLYSQYILPCIQDIEEHKMEECKEKYMQMVRSLEDQYIVYS